MNKIQSFPNAQQVKSDIKDKYTTSDKLEEWENFAIKMIKVYEVREHKREEQERKCLHCQEDLHPDNRSNSLHHLDYDHICKNKDRRHKYRVKEKNDDIEIPPCKSCKEESPKLFNQCMDKIVYVHQECHNVIHEIEEPVDKDGNLIF